ncbi:dicarboxylate/amino acid:cation symporter [Rickettsiales bacterium LUAb2]
MIDYIYNAYNWVYKKTSLNIMIFLAMLLAIVAGLVMKEKAVMFKPLGDIFLRLIGMVVIPLIVFSIISATAHLKDMQSPGKVSGFMFGYFFITTLAATLFGIIFALIFKPGILSKPIPSNLLDTANVIKVTDTNSHLQGFWDTIINIIPNNLLTALDTQNILQVLFFVIFFGIGLSFLPKEKKASVIGFFDGCNDIMIWMISKIMYFAPLGIFGLMSSAMGNFGYSLLIILLKLVLVCFLANVLFTYGILTSLVKLFSKVPVFTFLKETLTVQMVSFTTASSMATLPINMQACERMGVIKSIYSLILTVGATVNMNGNALFYAMAAVFIAQMYGIHLDLYAYIAIIVTSILGAIGTAGIPGPTLLLIVVIVAAKLPLEAISLLFAVDRIFDMMRTTVNCVGNASCAVIAQSIADKSVIKNQKMQGNKEAQVQNN